MPAVATRDRYHRSLSEPRGSLNPSLSSREARPPAPAPSLARLAEIFFRIGNTTFGGGYVTIGMLQRELVEQHRYITPAQFDLIFALSRITPGTILLAFCVASGNLLWGLAGAFATVLALTVPTAAIAVVFIYSFERWQDSTVGAAVIGATVAAVAGMMWSTIYAILRPHIEGTHRNLQIVLITGGAFIAAWYFGVTPLPIIIAGTLAGFLWQTGEDSEGGR